MKPFFYLLSILMVGSVFAVERYEGWQIGLGENKDLHNTLKESLQVHSYGYDSEKIKTFWGYRYLKHQSLDEQETVRTYGIEAGFRWQPMFEHVKPWIGLTAIIGRSRQCPETEDPCINDDRFWLEPSAGISIEIGSISISAYRQRLVPIGGNSDGMFDIPNETISSVMFSARF